MLGSDVRGLIAPVLKRCPPACGIMSITRVEVSPDSSYVTFYVSVLREPETAMAYLEAERPELQRGLSKLPRRVIPRVRFRLDKATEEGSRIDDLLREASKDLPQDS
jgi:ribosome-binding factor A